MAIAARFDDRPGTAGTSRAPRRTIRLQASGALASGDAAEVTVHNISATGMLIESRQGLEVGERLAIDLPQAGTTAATVVWTSDALQGCAFDRPVAPAVLSAAQLRSAVGQDLRTASRAPPASEESFGERLLRLRKQRGLSLAQVAADVGVSKPTVWAWEQGRARPVAGRIEGLARLLHVSPEELLSGRDEATTNEALARCRQQIAGMFGMSPDNVRIMIEL